MLHHRFVINNEKLIRTSPTLRNDIDAATYVVHIQNTVYCGIDYIHAIYTSPPSYFTALAFLYVLRLFSEKTLHRISLFRCDKKGFVRENMYGPTYSIYALMRYYWILFSTKWNSSSLWTIWRNCINHCMSRCYLTKYNSLGGARHHICWSPLKYYRTMFAKQILSLPKRTSTTEVYLKMGLPKGWDRIICIGFQPKS